MYYRRRCCRMTSELFHTPRQKTWPASSVGSVATLMGFPIRPTGPFFFLFSSLLFSLRLLLAPLPVPITQSDDGELGSWRPPTCTLRTPTHMARSRYDCCCNDLYAVQIDGARWRENRGRDSTRHHHPHFVMILLILCHHFLLLLVCLCISHRYISLILRRTPFSPLLYSPPFDFSTTADATVFRRNKARDI